MTSEDYAMISHHENMIDFMSTHKMNADNNKKMEVILIKIIYTFKYTGMMVRGTVNQKVNLLK